MAKLNRERALREQLKQAKKRAAPRDAEEAEPSSEGK
jgi:hypothetical protein